MQNSQKDFNEEPVIYCKHCLSLKIWKLEGEEFCDKCGSTELGSSSIEEWEKKYEERYGHKFIQ